MHREEILRMGVSGELVRVNYLGIKGVNSSFSQSGGELNILMVGSFDRRKGYDRLRPVMETLAKKKQKATFTIISAADAARMGLEQPYPAGIIVKWLHSLSKDELCRQYRETGVLLHLAR